MIRLSFAVIALLFLACRSAPVPQVLQPAAATEPADSQASGGSEDWVVLQDLLSTIIGNDNGVRVVLVPVASKSDPSIKDQYLLRATGSNSQFDGLAVRVRRVIGEHSVRYVAQLRGEPYWMLRHRSGSPIWEFHGYEHVRNRVEQLRPLDKSVDADLVLRERAKQRKTERRKIEATSRQEWEHWQQAQFAESILDVEGPCRDTKFSIDWSSVSDEMFSKQRISASCLPMIDAVADLCKQHAHAAEPIRDSMSFTCTFAGDPNEAASWQFVEESKGNFIYSPGQVEHEYQVNLTYLRKTLGELDQVFREGEKYFIMRFSDKADRKLNVFNGDGETFYPASQSLDSDPYHVALPRGAVQASLHRNTENDNWELACGRERKNLETLIGAERQAVLDRAKYEKEPKWKREPYFLSRDSHGTYYYVDRYRSEFGGKRYRVFVGRRGQLKLTKLKGLVEDSEGTLFSTVSGDLRLVVSSGTKTAIWIRGKRKTDLTPVRLRYSSKLIYDELGVYYGAELGLVCR